jgi:transcriptional regulator with GAF, ATPase, and Fis domain
VEKFEFEFEGPESVDQFLERIQRDIVHEALNMSDWNKSKAARLLGIKRTKLISRMKNRFGMPLQEPYRLGQTRARIKESETPA